MSTTDHPLSDFYHALGHRTLTALGVLWIDVGRFSLTCVPCSTIIDASQPELDELLWRSRRLAAVFPTSAPTGIEGGTLWVRDRAYGPQSLQRQFRQHVRRGEKLCTVRPIDWQTMRTQGLECNIDTMRRRGNSRSPIQTQAGWDRVCDAAAQVEGLEAFGCFREERLIAFLIAWNRDSRCAGLVMHRSEAAEEARGSHLLFYEFTKTIMQRDTMTGVSLGRVMLPPQRSLEQFKQHAGFQVEPVRIAAVLHPLVRPVLASSLMRGLLRKLGQWVGPRLAVMDNVAVLDAAAATQLPRR
ncbi:MAG: hypothetical protein ACK5TO_18210 [Planctomycetaceae bacterium]